MPTAFNALIPRLAAEFFGRIGSSKGLSRPEVRMGGAGGDEAEQGSRGGGGRRGRESVASERRELGVWYWAGEMRGWAGRALGGESLAGRLDSGASEVEVVGRGLVELEVGDGLWLGGVEGRCLIEEPGEEIALGRSARGREGRGL